MRSRILLVILIFGVFFLFLDNSFSANFIIRNITNPDQYYFIVNGTTGNVIVLNNLGIGILNPSERLEVSGNIKASMFIDLENAAYYLDPSGTSKLYRLDLPGISIGYDNSANAFSIWVSGNELIIEKDGTNWVGIWEKVKAHAYYDIDNINYYLDPANTGVSMKVAGEIQIYGGSTGSVTPAKSIIIGKDSSGNYRIEIRQIGGTPYIDFSNDATVDYDMRIRLTADDELRIEGGNLKISQGSLYVSGNIYKGNSEIVSRGIYAYKIKHSESTHPNYFYDLISRFVLKYLDNIETQTIIQKLSHSFNDDKYVGIYVTAIYIANDGYYDFGVNSDDASAVFVDGVLAVAWLGAHGTSSHWYQSAFNSICRGASDVDGDGIGEPTVRKVLHPNGIRLSKGWHIMVAIFEEMYGADTINVYIRPHISGEDPSAYNGTATGWKILGSDALSAGYISDYIAVPLGYAINLIKNWFYQQSSGIFDPELGRYYIRSTTYVEGPLYVKGTLYMQNYNIYGANAVIIADPGPGEGIIFANTAADWRIDVSPRDRSNKDGNLNLYGTAYSIVAWRPFEPAYNKTLNLGSPSYYWNTLYIGNISVLNEIKWPDNSKAIACKYLSNSINCPSNYKLIQVICTQTDGTTCQSYVAVCCK